MKDGKKALAVLFSITLVLAFCSVALAGAEYKATKVESLSLEEMQSQDAGVEAKPMPLPRLERPALDPQSIVPFALPSTEEFNDPENRPAGSQMSESSGVALTPMLGPCPASWWYQEYATDTTAWPNRAVAKVLFTGIDGGRYMCTGTVINQNMVLTAGHCVMTSGMLHSAFEITPGWYYGPTYYNTYTVNTVVYFTSWATSEDYRYDVAIMILDPSWGQYIGDEVGWLGFSTGADPTIQTWQENGYPWNLADGQALARVTSPFGHFDYWQGYPSNQTIGVGSNMLGGSSGGSWMRYTDEFGYQANGLNSYGYTDCEYTMYGPYFSEDIWNMYEYAKTLQ